MPKLTYLLSRVNWQRSGDIFRLKKRWRFLLVGGWNTFASYLIFFALCIFLQQENYQKILLYCFLLSTIHSYITQRIFVWNSRNKVRPEIIKFFALSIVFYLTNAFCLKILVDHFNMNILFSQLIITCLIVYVNFYIQKNYVFLEQKRFLN